MMTIERGKSVAPAPGERRYPVVIDGRVRTLPYSLAKRMLLVPRGACRSGLHRGDPPPAEPGAWWCSACTDRVRGWFRDVAKDWPFLVSLLRPGVSGRPEGGKASSDGSPAPLNVSVVDVVLDVEAWMQEQVEHLLEDRPRTQLPDGTAGGELAAWFARWHVDYVAMHPTSGMAEALPGELRERRGQVRSVTQAAGRRREWVSKACSESVTVAGVTEPCGRPMFFLHPGCEGDRLPRELRCEAGHRAPLVTSPRRTA